MAWWLRGVDALNLPESVPLAEHGFGGEGLRHLEDELVDEVDGVGVAVPR